MDGVYAFFRLLNTISAILGGGSKFAKRQGRKLGTRTTRKVVD